MTMRKYRVHGLHCAQEVRAIQQALDGMPGVADLQFDVLAERLVLRATPEAAESGRIEQAIETLGMRAEPWADAVGKEQTDTPRMWLAGLSGGALLVALLWYIADSESVWHALVGGEHEGPLHPVPMTLYAVAAAAGLANTLPKALRSMRAARLDMNVLVLIAIAGAAVLGEWSEGATVASLFAVANALEAWSASRARYAVTGLMRLTPHHANVVHHDHEHRVPVEHVQPGTVILVRPGERVPIDGDVVSGVSSLDEAALSGESVPVLKHAGDTVFAGTLNGSGALEVRTTRRASESSIARMVAMVDAARLRRTSTEQWIERFARYYTPSVIAIALGIAIVPPLLGLGSWPEWFYRGLVTTLIACPCALVISTPVTIVAALASAARLGVLVKGGEALEALARTTTFAFDKTGVLTQGVPKVEVLEPLAPHSRSDVLQRLLAVECRSEHPLARAIVAHARAEGVEAHAAADVQAVHGAGAEGLLSGEVFWIGSHRLAHRHHVKTADVDARVAALEAQGLSVVLCGDASSVWALVGLRDAPREDALVTLEALRGAGITSQVLLTGDNQSAAELIARALGISDVRAGLLPSDKEAAIRTLTMQGARVTMVGDGVNDTAAMAAASVGIAMGPRSTDAALETADIVIATDDLRRVSWTLAHARRALAVVKQNVWISVGAKLAFVVLAATGHATLWMAVAADTGATIVVTLNGLRLLGARGAHRDRPPARPAAATVDVPAETV
jgi:Zn2+/Cd2+-exporting ATPase